MSQCNPQAKFESPQGELEYYRAKCTAYMYSAHITHMVSVRSPHTCLNYFRLPNGDTGSNN